MENSKNLQLLNGLYQVSAYFDDPKDLFSGFSLQDSFAPEKILFFRGVYERNFLPQGFGENFHHRFELAIALNRQGNVLVGEQMYTLCPGEAVLIFPHQFRHFIKGNNGDLEWIFLMFETGREDVLRRLINSPRILDSQILESLTKIVGLYCESQKMVAGRRLKVSSELATLLQRMKNLPKIPVERRTSETCDNTQTTLLEQVNTCIKRNIHRSLHVGKLASEMGYSTSHLRCLFREHFCMSPSKYVLGVKLNYAAQLLQRDRKSITVVARMSGFESLYTFSRSFKRVYRISPKTFSQQVAGRR